MSKCFACMHASIPSPCLMPMEFRRGTEIVGSLYMGAGN